MTDRQRPSKDKSPPVARQQSLRANLELRAGVVTAVREFFAEHDYLEIETPLRIPAPAPETHIDAISCGTWYLHTSPELCMKRMLAAGYERIFQICKCFRDNERGHRHLPEMTLVEWYTAGANYLHMMEQCEALILFVTHKLGMNAALTYQDRAIDLKPPWTRMTVRQAFERYADCSLAQALKADRFDEIMGLQIEPRLGWPQPTFLMDYPRQHAALARSKPDQPEVAERFELYIAGVELCNAFSELTDAQIQRRRFEREMAERRDSNKIVYPLPEPFLEMLGMMPDATGNALGLDRLVMLLCDARCIDDVVAFTPEEL